jgi:dipeptidyl aminopeptidase/acylaminoacyl peptidase
MSDPTAQIRKGLMPEDLFRFRWVEELRLDPTGQVAAYTVKRADAEGNGYRSDVHVRRLDAVAPERVSPGTGLAGAIAWSRDGSRLAYSYSEGSRHSVRIWSANGGEQLVIPLDGPPMGDLDWAPDGERLAGVRWTQQRREEDIGHRPGIPAPTIKVVRRLRYKQDGVGWVHDRFSQIWLLELRTGALTQLTDSECDYAEPRWSNGGDRIAFTGVTREQNIDLGQGAIFICDLPGGTPRPLLPGWVGQSRSPAWGPDDRTIAFAGHTHPAPTNRRIFAMPYLADVEAGTARPLANHLDQEVGNYAIADQRAGLSNITVRWPPGGEWIYFLLTVQGATHLYRVSPDGPCEALVEEPAVVFEYGPTAGGRVLYGKADPRNPGDLYLWEGGASLRLTALNSWLNDRWLAEPQEYWYDGLEGAKVHAWVMDPPGLDPAKRHPLILYVHCSMFSWDFSHEFQCLAAAGFVVAYFNQRGTTAGYGQAWTRASEGDQGGKDFEEIMVGLDDLLERRPYIDQARMGVTGGSCGGFMTNWIVGHSDRFKAAVTQRSISNQISFFGTADIGPEGTRGETSDDPWSNMAAVWRQSPLAYATNVRTPLLIIHSDEDHRCPLEQAEQLFAALRWRGCEVEMVIFEGENHGLSRGGRPGNRIERLRRIQGWFQRYIGTHPQA